MRTTTYFAVVLSLAACGKLPGKRERPTAVEQPTFSVDPAARVESSKQILETGSKIYARQCAPCHGETGAGDGPAAYLLYPKPRNFKKGPFRIVSTWEGVPTDDDLYRTISRGIPGSAMPSWSHLTSAERWSLVHYVKSLTTKPVRVAPSKPAQPENFAPGEGIVMVPAEPPADARSIAKGSEIFGKTCMPCHGPRGQGDGPNAAALKDEDGIPIRPRDLTTGVFKGDPRPEHLFRRIVHGIAGTPMPSTPNIAGEDGWHVVHFVRSLSSDRLRDRAEMKRFRVPVTSVDHVPEHPDSGDWNAVPKTELHLMPLWWRYDRPEYLSVQAVYDRESLALLLVWGDVTQDDLMIRPQDFRDAAAIEFAAPGADPPFFAMGEKGRYVNLWMWKSERQADLKGFHDLESQYPNIGIDSYPDSKRAPYEQPMRNAHTIDSDPASITAWGAGNIVADPTRKSAGEDLRAEGFGTLRARPRENQGIHADGAYSNGSYRVAFRRSLKPAGEGAVDFTQGDVFPAAFAIWNGSAGDRNGKKSVTIWQELVFLREREGANHGR